MKKLARGAMIVAVIAAAVFALLLGAVVVCFGVPLAYSIGGDLLAAARPRPLFWISETAAAALLLWRLRRRASGASEQGRA